MKLSKEKQQHFLKNEKILKKEIKIAKLSKNDNVLEIGAGDGRLTKLISEKVNSLTVYELDAVFKPIFENLRLKNTKLIFDNALSHSWKGHNKIVSNIPYSLSEPVIMKAIKEGIKEATLTVGENFAKLLKEKETKIGVIANLYFDVKFIEKIPKEEFEPPPRVNSYLIHLKRKKSTEIELLIQTILEKESKTKNAIIKAFKKYEKTKNEVRRIIKETGLNFETLEKSTKTISGKFIETLREKLSSFL